MTLSRSPIHPTIRSRDDFGTTLRRILIRSSRGPGGGGVGA
jgi:hypothetical protein